MIMTDCALAAPDAARTPAPVELSARRRRRRLPVGFPRWTHLVGVTVTPLAPQAPGDPQQWVMSAGLGGGFVAAVFWDGPGHPSRHDDTDITADPGAHADAATRERIRP
jgi:hypothetical protein